MANAKQNTEVRVPIRETFTLPSNGIPYNGEVPAEITLRAMTTMDEKIRLSGSGLNSLTSLVNACTIEPENFDSKKLKLYDLQYLMYMLRVITYGSNYKVSAYCDHCEKYVDINVDIDKLEIIKIEDNYVEPFEIGPLPVSGDVLTCKNLSVGDLINIDRESQRILAKFKDYVGDPEFVLGFKYLIQTVNGEALPDFKKQQYVENMNAMDLRFLDLSYDKFVSGFGINTNVTAECPSCGAPVEFSMPITEEFFRPQLDI